jgi:hypothetical protein
MHYTTRTLDYEVHAIASPHCSNWKVAALRCTTHTLVQLDAKRSKSDKLWWRQGQCWRALALLGTTTRGRGWSALDLVRAPHEGGQQRVPIALLTLGAASPHLVRCFFERGSGARFRTLRVVSDAVALFAALWSRRYYVAQHLHLRGCR